MKKQRKRKIELLVPISPEVREEAIRSALKAGIDGFILNTNDTVLAGQIHSVAEELHIIPELLMDLDASVLENTMSDGTEGSTMFHNLRRLPITGIILKNVESEIPLLKLKQFLVEQELVHLRILASVGSKNGIENAILLPPHCDMIVYDRSALEKEQEIPIPEFPLMLRKTARMCALTKTPLMIRGGLGIDLKDPKTCSDLYIAFSFGIRAFVLEERILTKDPYEMLDIVNGYYEMLKQQLIPEM